DMCNELGGRKAPREYSHETHDDALRDKVYKETFDKVYEIAKSGSAKKDRRSAFDGIIEEFLAKYSEEELATLDQSLVKKYYGEVQYDAMRKMVLDEKIRLDGRKMDEVRSIWSEVDYLPAAHGSAVFTRGETQALTSVTLGSKLDEQMLDSPMN